MDKDRTGAGDRINEDLDPADLMKIEELLCDLKQLQDRNCADCGAGICGHEALMSLTMGFKDAPRCWTCLADALEYEKDALRDHVFAYITHRPCHYEGWKWANREEGFETEPLPRCLWPAASSKSAAIEWDPAGMAGQDVPVPDADSRFDAEWDAGDLGCGDLVLELRNKISVLKPGQIIKLRATDSGAPQDLPAWCRVTGHALVSGRHPIYLIQRKEISI
jgi:tRNA 2-thiouridine synthesizing protein A